VNSDVSVVIPTMNEARNLPWVLRRIPEWVDELRWGAVLLAAFGLRAAAARRRGATFAALVLGGWLLAADAVLTRLSLVDRGWENHHLHLQGRLRSFAEDDGLSDLANVG